MLRARNDCIYTFSMDGVEGAGPLPRDAGTHGGRSRPDQSFLDAGAPAQAVAAMFSALIGNRV